MNPSQSKVAGRAAVPIIPAVLRRAHVPRLTPGDLPLDPAQARHLRDVLRLDAGAAVEVFDDAGAVAAGTLVFDDRDVRVRVQAVTAGAAGFEWTIAAAVPKGERADWMVEKLSELGTAEFLPLAAARSVVLPEGRNKRERWARIATEAAKQSRRAGVMRIGELTRVGDALAAVAGSPGRAGWYFSTAPDARPAAEAAAALPPGAPVCAFVGPEGGWSDDELSRFAAAGLTPVRLTHTVLRVETAAIAAAALIGSLAPALPRPPTA
jgi:16S rRNA (uracil1498-N3)-methyltransferase